MSTTMPALLAGVRVLDLSLFVAGPFGSMILGDLGAEVVKIEPIEGDPIRSNRMGETIAGESAQFQSYNRNKKSVCINLKSAPGRALFLDLVTRADVVYENYRPGVLERLGLDYATLSVANRRIVLVSISAFGADGPLAKSPGYDLIVQALGGGMSLAGHPASGPAHIPFHLGDTAGGLYGAIAILAALVERNRTGVGRAIEIGLLDAQLALLSDEVTNYGVKASVPPMHGSGHPQLVPYRAFMTSDAPLVVAAVGVEKFWLQLTQALGRPDLAVDARFADNRLRVVHRAVLEAELESAFRARTRDDWLARLAAADVPAAPVLDIAAAIDHPQVRHRQAVVGIDCEGEKPILVTRTPIRVRDAAPHSVAMAPRRGEHTQTVLSEQLGLDDTRLEQLAREGVIGL